MNPAVSADIVQFEIGQIVRLRTNRKTKGVIRGIVFRQTGVQYLVLWDDETEEKCCYSCEITK